MIAACFAGETVPVNPYAAPEPEAEPVPVSAAENEKAWMLMEQMLRNAVAAAR